MDLLISSHCVNKLLTPFHFLLSLISCTRRACVRAYDNSQSHLKLLHPFLLQLFGLKVKVISTASIAVQQQERVGPLHTQTHTHIGTVSFSRLLVKWRNRDAVGRPSCCPSLQRFHLVSGSSAVRWFPSARRSRHSFSCRQTWPCRRGRRTWGRAGPWPTAQAQVYLKQS